MAGLMSFLLYWVLRLAVLRGEGSYKRAIWCLPILLFVTLFVNMFFILYKVRQGRLSDTRDAAYDPCQTCISVASSASGRAQL
jgi:hypothetical protein